jgi:hypothetical protein
MARMQASVAAKLPAGWATFHDPRSNHDRHSNQSARLVRSVRAIRLAAKDYLT